MSYLYDFHIWWQPYRFLLVLNKHTNTQKHISGNVRSNSRKMNNNFGLRFWSDVVSLKIYIWGDDFRSFYLFWDNSNENNKWSLLTKALSRRSASKKYFLKAYTILKLNKSKVVLKIFKKTKISLVLACMGISLKACFNARETNDGIKIYSSLLRKLNLWLQVH